MERLSEVFSKAAELYREGDVEKAQAWVNQHFGEDTDLNIVKCKQCGEIIALTASLMGVALTGGDKRINLEIYRHLETYPTHHDMIVGLSHGVEIPIGVTLWTGLAMACKKHGLTIDEGIRERIEYLENRLAGI